jgi:hypothetical protein
MNLRTCVMHSAHYAAVPLAEECILNGLFRRSRAPIFSQSIFGSKFDCPGAQFDHSLAGFCAFPQLGVEALAVAVHHHVGQRCDNPGAGSAAFRSHQQAFARVFVDQVEEPHAASTLCPCAHEVLSPHMVPMGRAQPHPRAIVEPGFLRRLTVRYSHFNLM